MNNLGKFIQFLGNLGKAKAKVSESKNSKHKLGILNNNNKNTRKEKGKRRFSLAKSPLQKDKE